MRHKVFNLFKTIVRGGRNPIMMRNGMHVTEMSLFASGLWLASYRSPAALGSPSFPCTPARLAQNPLGMAGQQPPGFFNAPPTAAAAPCEAGAPDEKKIAPDNGENVCDLDFPETQEISKGYHWRIKP